MVHAPDVVCYVLEIARPNCEKVRLDASNISGSFFYRRLPGNRLCPHCAEALCSFSLFVSFESLFARFVQLIVRGFELFYIASELPELFIDFRVSGCKSEELFPFLLGFFSFFSTALCCFANPLELFNSLVLLNAIPALNDINHRVVDFLDARIEVVIFSTEFLGSRVNLSGFVSSRFDTRRNLLHCSLDFMKRSRAERCFI